MAWIRLVAYLIDTLMVGIPFFMLAWPMLTVEMDAAIAAVPDTGKEVVLKWILIYGTVKSLYAIGCEGSSLQATVGKLLLGLVVTNKDMTKPGLFSVIMRNTVARIIVNVTPFYLGFAMIFMNKRKQGLHDWMSGTMVCRQGQSSTQAYADVFA